MNERLILVGLGNPGSRYEWTPHNVGFMALDLLAEKHGVRWRNPRKVYAHASYRLDTLEVDLIKPLTYMNLSGRALMAFTSGEAPNPAEIVVLLDDIALPLGRLRLRSRGSDGGHNGLKSLSMVMRSNEYARLRMGVGPVPSGVDPADFVLDTFPDDARQTVVEEVERAVACVDVIAAEGVETAMNLFNRGVAESD